MMTSVFLSLEQQNLDLNILLLNKINHQETTAVDNIAYMKHMEN